MHRIICDPTRPGRPLVPTVKAWQRWQSDNVLTDQELSVLLMVEQGENARHIAKELGVSPQTATGLITRILRMVAPPWSDTVV